MALQLPLPLRRSIPAIGRMFQVLRLDLNPVNTNTVNTWVFVSDFDTWELANAYIRRAATPTQILTIAQRSN